VAVLINRALFPLAPQLLALKDGLVGPIHWEIASKMPKVEGPMRMANQAIVSGSSWTTAKPLLRKLSTSDSLPGFASKRTIKALVTCLYPFDNDKPL
jgi:hypothetical protein